MDKYHVTVFYQIKFKIFIWAGVSKWAGTRYFYSSEIVYSTGRNYWTPPKISGGQILHKDEKILGRKHIYLPHAQIVIYDSKVKLFLKQGISHHLGRG
jgi:hypothetical protein